MSKFLRVLNIQPNLNAPYSMHLKVMLSLKNLKMTLKEVVFPPHIFEKVAHFYENFFVR